VSSDAELPLSALATGRSAIVLEVRGPSPRVAQRLLDLGFVPGTRVRALRRAPLGDPVEYEVRGSRICLRASEAGCIRVAAE
jgi:Fe2+ transport system protein FeoA